MTDKPDPAEDFGIASSCAALAGTPAGTIAATVAPLTMADLKRIDDASLPDTMPPSVMARCEAGAERRAEAWRSAAVKAAARFHGYHTSKGTYPGYRTWHDCQHPGCKAFRVDALKTTPLEITL